MESLVVHPSSYECYRIGCPVLHAKAAAQCSSGFAHGRVIHCHVNSTTETVNSHFALWYRRWADPQSLDVSSPEGLVPKERADNALLGVKSLLDASSEKNISAGTTSSALSRFAIDCQSG